MAKYRLTSWSVKGRSADEVYYVHAQSIKDARVAACDLLSMNPERVITITGKPGGGRELVMYGGRGRKWGALSIIGPDDETREYLISPRTGEIIRKK